MISSSAISTFVQIRVEIFKKMVACKSKTNQNQIEEQEDSRSHFEFNENTLRFAWVLISLCFLIVIDWILRRKTEEDNIYVARIRIFIITKFIGSNILMILIMRNPKLYEFCKNQIKCVWQRK